MVLSPARPSVRTGADERELVERATLPSEGANMTRARWYGGVVVVLDAAQGWLQVRPCCTPSKRRGSPVIRYLSSRVMSHGIHHLIPTRRKGIVRLLNAPGCKMAQCTSQYVLSQLGLCRCASCLRSFELLARADLEHERTFCNRLHILVHGTTCRPESSHAVCLLQSETAQRSLVAPARYS